MQTLVCSLSVECLLSDVSTSSIHVLYIAIAWLHLVCAQACATTPSLFITVQLLMNAHLQTGVFDQSRGVRASAKCK
jgi:hypothetical protein